MVFEQLVASMDRHFFSVISVFNPAHLLLKSIDIYGCYYLNLPYYVLRNKKYQLFSSYYALNNGQEKLDDIFSIEIENKNVWSGKIFLELKPTIHFLDLNRYRYAFFMNFQQVASMDKALKSL